MSKKAGILRTVFVEKKNIWCRINIHTKTHNRRFTHGRKHSIWDGNGNNYRRWGFRRIQDEFLTKSSKSPASIAKSNKQWVGTCLYQEACKRLLINCGAVIWLWASSEADCEYPPDRMVQRKRRTVCYHWGNSVWHSDVRGRIRLPRNKGHWPGFNYRSSWR